MILPILNKKDKFDLLEFSHLNFFLGLPNFLILLHVFSQVSYANTEVIAQIILRSFPHPFKLTRIQQLKYIQSLVTITNSVLKFAIPRTTIYL
jgi:hypothetical protein